MAGVSAIQVVAVIVRLFAIALFVYAIRQLPDLVTYYVIDSDRSTGVPFYGTRVFVLSLTIFLCLVISLLLWFFPLTIAQKLLPNMDDEEGRKWDKDTLLSIAFIVLGVYFYYYALVDLLYWGMMLILSIRHFDLIGPLEVENWVNIVLTFVELFLATMLVFRSRGIANLILKFRGRLE